MTIVHGSKHQPISLTYVRQKKHKANLFDRGYESFLKRMLHGIPIRIWIEKPVDFTTIKSVKYVPGTGGGWGNGDMGFLVLVGEGLVGTLL